MMYRTHALFGFLIGLLIYGLDLDSLILVLLVMAGALIPDLDTSVSFLGRRLKIISYPLKLFFTHRGFTHSLFFMLIAASIGMRFFPGHYIAMLVGIVSHVLLDCLTRDGVRVLWPFQFKLRGFLRTNGLFEKVFFIGMIMYLFPDPTRLI